MLLLAASCVCLCAQRKSVFARLQLAQGVRLCRLRASPQFAAWAQRKEAQRRRGRLLAALALALVLAALLAALTGGRSAPGSPQMLALPHGREHKGDSGRESGQEGWRSAPAVSRQLALPRGGGVRGYSGGEVEMELVYAYTKEFGGRHERLAALQQLALPIACGAPATASGAGPEALKPYAAEANGAGALTGPAGHARAVLVPPGHERGPQGIPGLGTGSLPLPRGGSAALALSAGSGRGQLLPWRGPVWDTTALGAGLLKPYGVLRRAYAACRQGCANGLRLTGWAARTAFGAVRAASQLLRQRLATRSAMTGSRGDGLRLELSPGQGPGTFADQCPVPGWHVRVAGAAAGGLAGGGAGVGVGAVSADSSTAVSAALSGADFSMGAAAEDGAPSASQQPTCQRETAVVDAAQGMGAAEARVPSAAQQPICQHEPPWQLAALAAPRPPKGGAPRSRASPVCQAAGYWRPAAGPACLLDERLSPPAGAAEAASSAAPAAQNLPHGQEHTPAAPATNPCRGSTCSRAALRRVMPPLAGWVLETLLGVLWLLAAGALAALLWREYLRTPPAAAGGRGSRPPSASAAPGSKPGREGLRAGAEKKARHCIIECCRLHVLRLLLLQSA